MHDEIHRPNCDRHACTLHHHDGNEASMARRRGWGVGTVIEGDEGFGPCRIMITAIGERALLARCVEPNASMEATWTLSCRCWGEVIEPMSLATMPDAFARLLKRLAAARMVAFP